MIERDEPPFHRAMTFHGNKKENECLSLEAIEHGTRRSTLFHFLLQQSEIVAVSGVSTRYPSTVLYGNLLWRVGSYG